MDSPSLQPFEPSKVHGTNGSYSWKNPKLVPNLIANHEDAADRLIGLQTDNDVANLLELPVGQLLYILYEKSHPYTSFEIPKKSGGHRLIDSPCKPIKILQHKIKPLIEAHYRVKKPAHGFVGNGKGIITNAEQHKKKKYVFNLDLKDFFHSVNFGRVRGIFMHKPFDMGDAAATVIAQLCTYNGRLAQGAPTSPVLSNLAATSLDKTLVQLAKRYHLTYTRYADDITFSSNKIMPDSIVHSDVSPEGIQSYKVGHLLKAKIENCGFTINEGKTRLQHKSDRQEVTGLVVNDVVNVNRKFIRNTRAMIHDWQKDLLEAEKHYLRKRHNKSAADIATIELNGDIFKQAVYGRLSFIAMIRGPEYSPYLTLCEKVIKIDPAPPKNINQLKDVFEQYDVFICHASEDKEAVAIPLYEELKRRKIEAFIDCFKIGWGDSLVDKINTALRKSKFVLAIISKDSINKNWPMRELNAVISSDISGGGNKLLPLVVGDSDELMKELPLLAGKLFEKFDDNIEDIAKRLEKKLLNI